MGSLGRTAGQDQVRVKQVRPLGLNEVSKRGHWGGQQGQDQVRVKQVRLLGLNEVSKRGHWGGQQGQDQVRVKQVRFLGLNEGGCIVSVCPPAILAPERVGHLITPLLPLATQGYQKMAETILITNQLLHPALQKRS